MILCDTNVLIDAFNRRPATLAALDGIGYDRVVLSAVTVMELYRGTRNKEQLAQLRRRIRYFGVVRFSEAVADLATGCIEAFHLPHGLESRRP